MPSPSLTRRRFLGTAAAAAALAPRSVRGQRVVKIGNGGARRLLDGGPVIVALEKGFFKDEGSPPSSSPSAAAPTCSRAVMAARSSSV